MRDAIYNLDIISNVDKVIVSDPCAIEGQCPTEKFNNIMSGYHGHLIFGTGPFYISHLPLFMQPHNYQAIYEVDFGDSEAEQKLRQDFVAALNKQGGYGTFAPEVNPENGAEDSTRFKIPEFTCHVNAGRDTKFFGEIFSGHFERGGAESIGMTGLKVLRVVYYKELALDPEPAADVVFDPSSEGEYILFGSPGAYFAARKIGARPDMDHIFPVQELPSEFVSELAGKNHLVVSSSRESENKRDFTLEGRPQTLAVNDLYRELNELR